MDGALLYNKHGYGGIGGAAAYARWSIAMAHYHGAAIG
jgi:hypothetical protein